MFPIDYGFNTLKVKVTVTFKVDSQYVNPVRSITRVRLGLGFKTSYRHWSYRVDVPY